MSKQRRGHGSRYGEDFKRQLVAEGCADGATVPMIAARHGVPPKRLYIWRKDPRFQPTASEAFAFTSVEISDGADGANAIGAPAGIQIEITLENGRTLSVDRCIDVGFVLELARGLAA